MKKLYNISDFNQGNNSFGVVVVYETKRYFEIKQIKDKHSVGLPKCCQIYETVCTINTSLKYRKMYKLAFVGWAAFLQNTHVRIDEESNLLHCKPQGIFACCP